MIQRNLVAEWNIACGKNAPEGKEARNLAIKNQVKLILEECNEVLEAIDKCDDNNLLKELADVKVVTDGLFFVSGMPVEEAFTRVMEDNNLKFTEDLSYIKLRSDEMGYLYDTHSIVGFKQEDNCRTYSVHRLSDDKVCKLIKHKELDFSYLIN